MSDVQTFSGHSGQNSSRVLAPPGGHSSFSFCDGSSLQPAGPVKRSTYNHNHHSVSQIPFGNAPAPAHVQPTATTMRTPATTTATTTTAVPSYSAPAAPKPRTTLRAQNYDLKVEAGKHRENVHTSSRVLAPPGGHCHNIFG